MRDWPLLLVASALFAGAATRYVVEEGDVGALFVMLACLGSASFGAWLYSVGVDKERDKPVRE